jgi:UDP-glucose:(heptosyl)LPS alpha-1,3-glucosyltransferase
VDLAYRAPAVKMDRTRMDVALVILRSDPQRGGAERYTADLATALAGRGHDVTVVSADAGPRGDRAHRSVTVDAGGATRRGQYLSFLRSVDDHLAKARYDVVHAMLPVRSCDVYHPHAGLAAEGVASGHAKYDGAIRRLLAMGANRVNRKRQAFAAVERDLLDRPDGPVVLCLSDYVKETVRRHYATVPESRLATLFNAVDLRRFDPTRDEGAGRELRRRMGIADDRVVALMIAQDFARKGLREAILALRELADVPVTLVVVGRGDAGPYQRLARQARVSSHVVFAGPTADPYPFYRAADLFVLPTRHDPCSLVVLEALAMGVPVVSTVFNGACEIMTDGVHGRVLKDPGDVGALATAMRDLMDEQTRRSAREACLKLRPRLSFDAHVDRLLSIYEQTAKQPS